MIGIKVNATDKTIQWIEDAEGFNYIDEGLKIVGIFDRIPFVFNGNEAVIYPYDEEFFWHPGDDENERIDKFYFTPCQSQLSSPAIILSDTGGWHSSTKLTLEDVKLKFNTSNRELIDLMG
jgi:hypothetical protein